MVSYENDCCNCDIPCTNCGLKSQPHLYCDSCGEESDILYRIQGVETDYLCEDCLKEYIDTITKSYTIDDFIE